MESVWRRLEEAQGRLAAELDGLDVTEAELAKALGGAVTYGYLQQVCADPDHPAFLPGPGYHLHVGTPNPDTVYLTAAIDGRGQYRLTGSPGTVPDLTLMPMGPPTAAGVQTYQAFDLTDLEVDAEGSVDVVLSATRPPGHTGTWWELAPEVTSLMLRSVSDDWGRHREPLLALTRLDVPTRRGRTDEGVLARRWSAVGALATRAVGYGIQKVEGLRAQGVVNAVAPVDYSANGGLAGQWYFEGVYDLRGGDVVLVEVQLAATPTYVSLSLTDGMFSTLDWVHAQTSLNRNQAVLDDDGWLRAVVALDDPGVANWLDTTGHHVGVVQLRIAGGAEAPVVEVRPVRRDDLPPAMARVSPAERAEVLAERARRAQLRALW